jgi:hypothetical protein
LDVRRLRNEVGELTIDDKTKIHLIGVHTNDDLKWKWRVWIPEGTKVVARYQWGRVPRDGVPRTKNILVLDPGEQWITLTALRDADGKNWVGRVETPLGSIDTIIPAGEQFFDLPSKVVFGAGLGYTTEVLDSDVRSYVMYRYRVGQFTSSKQLSDADELTAGFIIWLERQ